MWPAQYLGLLSGELPEFSELTAINFGQPTTRYLASHWKLSSNYLPSVFGQGPNYQPAESFVQVIASHSHLALNQHLPLTLFLNCPAGWALALKPQHHIHPIKSTQLRSDKVKHGVLARATRKIKFNVCRWHKLWSSIFMPQLTNLCPQ